MCVGIFIGEIYPRIFYIKYFFVGRSILKSPLEHKRLITESKEKLMLSVSDWQTRKMNFVLRLSRNLFHILKNILTLVVISHKGDCCK